MPNQANLGAPPSGHGVAVLPPPKPPAPGGHPLPTSYAPGGAEPASGDVAPALGGVARMLGQQPRLQAAGQLGRASATGVLFAGGHSTVGHANIEVRLCAWGYTCWVCYVP